MGLILEASHINGGFHATTFKCGLVKPPSLVWVLH